MKVRIKAPKEEIKKLQEKMEEKALRYDIIGVSPSNRREKRRYKQRASAASAAARRGRRMTGRIDTRRADLDYEESIRISRPQYAHDSISQRNMLLRHKRIATRDTLMEALEEYKRKPIEEQKRKLAKAKPLKNEYYKNLKRYWELIEDARQYYYLGEVKKAKSISNEAKKLQVENAKLLRQIQELDPKYIPPEHVPSVMTKKPFGSPAWLKSIDPELKKELKEEYLTLIKEHRKLFYEGKEKEAREKLYQAKKLLE